MKPSRRALEISFSATLALDARAKELAASGVDVINMSVGQPDFRSPAVVREAAAEMGRSGSVRYTPVAGLPDLRETIAAHLTRTRGTTYAANEITVCHGAKHALSGTLLALVDPGDDVLLFNPAWSSYVDEVRFAGGRPVEVDPRPDCGPDFEAIERAIGPQTRGVMLNTPNNPSGYVWSEDEVRQLTDLAEKHDLWILSDEIYSRLVYDGDFASPASVSPAARERTIVVDGGSKTYAMTGFRIGYLAAPEPIAAAVARIHSQLTGCPNALSQTAYQAALREEPPEVNGMVEAFAGRRKLICDGLKALGLETPWPRGAFYAFPNVRAHYERLEVADSEAFCQALLEDQAVAIVPGKFFGMDDHVRLSYATSSENIERALERLGKFLAK